MQSYVDHVADMIAACIDLPKAEIAEAIECPPDANMGDFGFPCFALAKSLRRAPAQIAAELAERIAPVAPVVDVRSIGPYLNFFVDRTRFGREVLDAISALGPRYGASDEGAGRKVLVEFSSPNIAKPFGVGHLRSTVIGGAIARIYAHLGYEVVRINHVGDWGTQFGKMITAFKRWAPKADPAKFTVDQQYQLYVRFHKEAESDDTLEDEARDWHRRIEEHDEEARALWQTFRDASLKDFQTTYDLLNVQFDSWAGESFYEDMLDGVVQRAEEAGIAKLDQGAIIVDLSEYELPPCLLRKSDGATLYATRDLAAVLYRWETYHFDRLIYVVGAPQNLHFQQLFGMLRRLGMPWVDRCVHVNFGHIRGMKTREGTLVLLEDLLGRSIDMVREIVRERQMDVDDVDEIARQVGIGAVVFADLSRRRIKDIEFDWEEILNFEGETGPYVQYTHARLCSILGKHGAPVDATADPSLLTEAEEWRLVRALVAFPAAVHRAAEADEPSLVSAYLLQLCATANQFYQRHRVLDPDAPERTKARIRLVDATRQTVANALGLLGIAAPERM
jgi:arginyl-tRNA synthetase